MLNELRERYVFNDLLDPINFIFFRVEMEILLVLKYTPE